MNEDPIQDTELRRLAERLGKGAADRLNVERTAAAVVERLRREPRPGSVARRWWSQPVWWRVAAAVVLLVGAGLLLRPHSPSHPPHYVADELRDLSTDQLQEVLGNLEQTLAQPAAMEPAEDDLDGLTTEQLEQLLRSLEG